MNNRNGHNAKNNAEKQYYQSQLKKQDYEPTYDDSFDFKESHDPEIPDVKDFENKPIKKEPFGKKFQRHFKNNIFQWIIGLVVFAISIFFASYTWILAETKTNVQNNKDSINDIKVEISEINTTITDQYNNIEDELKQITTTIQQSNDFIIEKIHKNELDVVRLKTIEELNLKNQSIEDER